MKSLRFLFLLFSLNLISQIDFSKEYKKLFLNASDSLKGFDESYYKSMALSEGFSGKEMFAYLYRKARNYVNQKYNIVSSNTSNSKQVGNYNVMTAACNNEDFELGNGSGWTLYHESWTSGPCAANSFISGASEFWVLATPIADPQFPGGIPNSPLGGNFVAKLNDVNPTGASTMIRKTFSVNSNNALFQFAWAACFDGSGHYCCDNPFLKIRVLDCNNNVLSCPQISIVASGPYCSSGMPGFTTNSNGFMIKNWTVQSLDLTSFIGSCITIEVFVGDCTGGAHHGYAYFDAVCSPIYISVNNVQYPVSSSTVFACGTSNATLSAPPGLAPYNWNGPPGSGITNYPNQTFTTNTSGTYTLTLNPGGGCSPITRTVNLQFVPVPSAGFTTNNSCQNFTITNTGSGPPAIQSYSFLGTGSPANFTTTAGSSAVSFTSAGTYTILQNMSNGFCSSDYSLVIIVPGSLTANFSVNNVCMNAPVNFTDLSTFYANNQYYWDFQNNGTWDSNVQNPSFLYPAAGNYTVKLKVTNPSGCMDSITKPVSVYGRAVPDFTSNPVCFNTVMNFTNTTSTSVNPNTGPISTYQWYFGDGGQSSNQNPSYLYANPSNSVTNTTYTVKLIVTTSDGCVDSVQKTATVYSNPTPYFVADSVCLGQNTTLQDLSTGNGNPLYQFQWDFTNDQIADVINNSLSTQTVFPNAGNNTVNYTVVTNPVPGLFCKSSISKNVWVHPSPIPSLTHTNQCINSQPTPFDASNSSVAFGNLTFNWDFGDGNQIPNGNATPSHSYQSPGTYTVLLTLISSYGCSVQIAQPVDVWDTPKGHFTYKPHCFGFPTILAAHQASNSAPIAQFQWDLNGNPADYELNGPSGQYTFSAAGVQTVNLYLTSVHGCTALVSGSVFVNYQPKANFFAPKRSGCTDLCIPVKDSSYAISSTITEWKWDYGNGLTLNTSQSVSNTICYTNSSHTANKLYTIKLTVKTDSGCVDSVRKLNYITVYPKPLADFTWEGQDGDLLTPFIQFYNQSQGYLYFEWYFNDGIKNFTDSVNTNPKHYYDTDVPMDYKVWLAVRNYYGCKDTVAKMVKIEPVFIIYFPNAFTPNGDNINDYFFGKGVGISEYKMWIYDRWGEFIYYTDDINKGWDGRRQGSDQIIKSDVYVWKAKVKDFKGKWHEYTGHVTLLKSEQ